MNLKNQPPVFVPNQFRKEIEALSKATLATRAAGADELAVNEIMSEVRYTAEVMNSYRKQERTKTAL